MRLPYEAPPAADPMRTTASECRVRIHHLDRNGVPYEGGTVHGVGAYAYSVMTNGVDPEENPEPEFVDGSRERPTTLSSALRPHVRTSSQAPPPYVGLGVFALEIFRPGPNHNWIYTLFPRLDGRLLSYRNSDVYVVTCFGLASPNPVMGQLVKDFTPDRYATMLVGPTFHNPLVSA